MWSGSYIITPRGSRHEEGYSKQNKLELLQIQSIIYDKYSKKEFGILRTLLFVALIFLFPCMSGIFEMNQ